MQPSLAEELFPHSLDDRLRYIEILFTKCAEFRDEEIAAQMRGINEGRSLDPQLSAEPDPKPGLSQLTLSPEAKQNRLLQRVLETAKYYLFSGSKRIAPGGVPGRSYPMVGVR